MIWLPPSSTTVRLFRSRRYLASVEYEDYGVARGDRLFRLGGGSVARRRKLRRMTIWFSIWIWRVERCWSNLMMNLLSSWRKSPRYEVRVGLNYFDEGLAQSSRLRNWLLPTRSFLRRIGVSPQILRWFNLRFRSRPGLYPRGNAH